MTLKNIRKSRYYSWLLYKIPCCTDRELIFSYLDAFIREDLGCGGNISYFGYTLADGSQYDCTKEFKERGYLIRYCDDIIDDDFDTITITGYSLQMQVKVQLTFENGSDFLQFSVYNDRALALFSPHVYDRYLTCMERSALVEHYKKYYDQRLYAYLA